MPILAGHHPPTSEMAFRCHADDGQTLNAGISEPIFYGNLVYKFKRIVGKPNFSDQLKKIVKRYIRTGYNLDIMRQSACLVLNPITVYSYGLLFNCTTVGQASDYDGCDVKLSSVGWCLMLICTTVAQLEVFFSSDYL